MTDTWFRFIVKHVDQKPTDYRWYEMSFFSTWSRNSNILICFDVPDTLRLPINEALVRGSIPSYDSSAPYSLHSLLLTHLLPLYHESVWAVRNHVRQAEKARAGQHPVKATFADLFLSGVTGA